MHRTARSPASPVPGAEAGRSPPSSALFESYDAEPSAQDGAFIDLQRAYRPYAGLLRLHCLVAEGHARSAWHESALAARVHAGELFGFRWADAMWIPMFQFVPPGHAVAQAPQRVRAELGRSFDGWALAGWFVQPNAWLAGQRPIECLDAQLAQVLEAARADRFVVTG